MIIGIISNINIPRLLGKAIALKKCRDMIIGALPTILIEAISPSNERWDLMAREKMLDGWTTDDAGALDWEEVGGGGARK